jgi:hypothetical protein
LDVLLPIGEVVLLPIGEVVLETAIVVVDGVEDAIAVVDALVDITAVLLLVSVVEVLFMLVVDAGGIVVLKATLVLLGTALVLPNTALVDTGADVTVIAFTAVPFGGVEPNQTSHSRFDGFKMRRSAEDKPCP